MMRVARNLMLDRGFWSERTVPAAEVGALVERLRPMRSSLPLRRLGGDAIGGYLIPDDLEGIAACISPGVWIECRFDEALADLGMDVFIADAGAEGPPATHPRFHFSPLSFDAHSSGSRISADDFCRDIAPGADLLLDMDIEGAEYRTIAAMPDALLERFRIMVIEFHHLGNLHTPFGMSEMAPVFDRLLRTHHVVHIHPNNAVPVVSRGAIGIPPVMEFTFLRKDRGEFTPADGPFPHPLDVINHPELPDIALPPCWYRSRQAA